MRQAAPEAEPGPERDLEHALAGLWLRRRQLCGEAGVDVGRLLDFIYGREALPEA